MPYTSVDSDMHPSDLSDWAEAIIKAVKVGSYTPDSAHSHNFEPCLGGNAHGQGTPVYSCGCYQCTKVEPAHVSEQHQGLGLEQWLLFQEIDRSHEILPLKCKRSKSTFKSDTLEDICRKLGKAFELNGSTTHKTLVLNVVKCLKAAIDRQTEVLSKIFGVLESHAK
ncbi:hypothetical protein EDB19DRAFT_1834831 [Suillus lakei]|nr:hypothetical protein EDB19DRAFT_1834831 [Suillus lakei]